MKNRQKLITLLVIFLVTLFNVACTTENFIEELYNGPNNTVIDSLQNKGTMNIVTMLPLSAMKGDTITITGFGFKPSEKEIIKVIFGANRLGVVRIVNENEIRVEVPDSVVSARPKVWLNSNNFAYSPFIFQIIPLKITSFFPLSAAIGTQVSIAGTGFKNGVKVYFNNIEAVTEFVNSTTLRAIVPNGNVSGFVKVVQLDRDYKISEIPFTLEADPLTILSVTPLKVKAGDKITIIGTGFKPGEINKVFFGGSKIEGVAQITNTTSITATVPVGEINGPITVWQRTDRQITSTEALTRVYAPTITALSADILTAGSALTITGEDFSIDAEVLFGSTVGSIVSNNGTSIVATVPNLSFKDARTKLKVRNVADNQSSNSKDFIAWDASKYFSDDFNRADTGSDLVNTTPSLIGSNWLTRMGENKILENKISTFHHAKLKYIKSEAIVTAGQKYSFSFDAMVDHPNDGAVFAGCMFEIQPGDLIYKVVRFAASGTFQGLKTLDDGVNWASVLVNEPSPLRGQIWYRIVIYNDGAGSVTANVSTIDSTQVYSAVIPYAKANGGAFGLFTYGDLGQYDNFSVLIE